MTNLDPRIGTLNSGRFYAFANGYDQPETVGTLAEVEAALGLRPAPIAPAAKPGRLRTYAVTISPSVVLYSGGWAGADHVVDIVARSAAEAVKLARRQRREEEGRHAPTATFRAKRAED
jgi:hypothetical protein